MISSKAMANVLNDSLDYRHAGRTWRTTPYNILKKVEITSQRDISTNWQHLVFTLDKKYLRNSAIGFDQFRKDTEGNAMLKAFSFFVKMCYEMVHNGPQPGQQCAIFMEWVKMENMDKYIGIRLHLFSNRRVKNSKAYDIVSEMIQQNALTSQKTNRMFLQNRMDHDSWESITSYYDYATQVADVYTQSFAASIDMNDPKYSMTCHAANPEYVFDPNKYESIFKLNGADPLQNDLSIYCGTDGTMTFPVMERVYRMTPSDLHLDKFFRKYLPDYYFTRVIFPEATMTSQLETASLELKVNYHMHRDRFMNYLNSNGTKLTDNTWNFDPELKNDIIDTLGGHFTLYEVPAVTTQQAATDQSAWCRYVSKGSSRFLNNTMTADATPTVSPLIQTLLTDKHSLSDIDILRIRGQHYSEWITNRRDFQEHMVNEFVNRVWDDAYADVSEPARMILLWKANIRNSADMNFQFKKVDGNMSIFANRIIRLMEFYDKELFVSSAHKTLCLLHHSKYDSYRQQTNLHFNQAYTGEGATSKSYMFEMMEQMAIRGTIQTLTYQTGKADAVDGDQIDQIVVFNEAPPGMFMTNKNTDGQQEAMFKEKLTSMRVTVKEFWRDENTGERKNRVAKSQSIGVCMMATNDDPSECSEAMSTRFYWGQFHKYENLTRSIQVCMRGDRELEDCTEAKAEKNKWLNYCKEEQMRVWLVFKFIYMGILKKPTLKAADVVYDRMTSVLKSKYKVNIPPRTKERFEMLCTILTIVNALESTFNVHGGRHSYQKEWKSCTKEEYDETTTKKYMEKDAKNKETYWKLHRCMDQANEFHPMQLLDIEPFMFCTEEIAIFALTQISEEIVNPNEYNILKAIWELHKKSNVYREESQSTEDGQSIKITDSNYIRVSNGKRLLTEISNAIPASSGKMSKHNISSLLTEWNERCVSCPIYQECNQSLPGDRDFADMYPQPMKHNKEKKIQLIHGLHNTYIHIDLFKGVRNGVYTNVMKEAIKSLNHGKAFPHRKFLLGCSIRKDGCVRYPNVLDTIQLERVAGEHITLVNPLYRDAMTRTIKSLSNIPDKQRYTKTRVNLDLTILGATEHIKNLKICDKVDVNGVSKNYIDYYMKHSCVSQPLNYPSAIIDIEKNEVLEEECSGDEMADFDAIETMPIVMEPFPKRRRI